VAAAEATGTPLLRLQRPGWTAQPGDDWRWVDSLAEAADALRGFGSVFLTTGRRGLGAFAGFTGRVVVRSVDPPSPPLPPETTVILARGPFTVEEELAVLREHRVDVLVTKDSGGPMTAPSSPLPGNSACRWSWSAARRHPRGCRSWRRSRRRSPGWPAGDPGVGRPQTVTAWRRP
jgi:hypothetical protein